MAKNIIFDLGNPLHLPVPAGTKSGDPVVVGDFVGVALTDRANITGVDAFDQATGLPNPAFNLGGGNVHGEATVKRNGVAEFTVDFAVATVGLPIYITPAGALTATAAGNKRFGLSYTTKAAAAGPLRVVVGA